MASWIIFPSSCVATAVLSRPFARLRAAQDWASDKSYSDESVFVVHTASEVLETYRDGESVDEKSSSSSSPPHAAPVIPVDDALAAYCEQYIVCDDDVETVWDDDRNDSGGPACQDSSPSTGGRMISPITPPSPGRLKGSGLIGCSSGFSNRGPSISRLDRAGRSTARQF